MEKKENRCPLCKEEIKAEAIRCKHCKSSIGQANPDHNGTCPLCKEKIHPEAIKCKHCSSMLVTQANTIMPHAPFPAPPSFPRPKFQPPVFACGGLDFSGWNGTCWVWEGVCY